MEVAENPRRNLVNRRDTLPVCESTKKKQPVLKVGAQLLTGTAAGGEEV